MRLVDQLLHLSATDLANHLGCAHLSQLDRAAALGELRRPRRNDPMTMLLAERGQRHESAFLEHLRATRGADIVEIPLDLGYERVDLTLGAMRRGAGVIYQAPLGNERWFGRADFLTKTDRPSELGPWSYEVIDAKLATETRAGTLLQLCVYSELVAGIQGAWPESAHVVAPHHDFQPQSYRLAEYLAYHRLVKRRLEGALSAAGGAAGAATAGGGAAGVAAAGGAGAATYPEPVQHCDVCAWWARCDARRRADDHLCYVAGISRLQIKELRRMHVGTLEGLGDLTVVGKPQRGSRDALERTRDQAAIQLKARRSGSPQHEILAPLGAEHGFAHLPEPSPHDLFLDLEGDRLATDGGREYLFGYLARPGPDEDAGAPPSARAHKRADDALPPLQYHALWATSPAEEKRAFERVVDTILATFRAHPDMHVYHFGAYEPATFKRLSGRYATREAELDRILRAELFVDLYTIVRHSLKASVESYSIKELEQFYGLRREQDLNEATLSRRAIEWAIEMREDLGAAVGTDGALPAGAAAAPPGLEKIGPNDERSAPARAAPQLELELALDAGGASALARHAAIVELYNRDDCVSAERLRAWLETLRAQAERDQRVTLPRPELLSGDPSENVAETAEETQRVMDALLDGVPVDAAERDPEQQARWLMAHLLEWHRREDKASWWEFFRLRDLPLDDYENERSALAGLEHVETVGGTRTRPIQRHSFPAQDHDIRKGDKACLPLTGHDLGEIVAIDVAKRTIDVQHSGRYAAERPAHLFVKRNVPPGAKPDVLLEIGRWIAEHDIDAHGEHRAARDLLLRNPPRFVAGSRGMCTAAGSGSGAARPEAAAVRSNTVISFGAARTAREQRIAARIGAARAADQVDDEVREARRLGFELEHGVLPIQGPPGTGKTFTGSHMILELVKAGKKIGVTAVSHEAIRTLLLAVCDRATEQGLPDFKCLHKGNPKDGYPPAIHAIDNNARIAELFLHGTHSLLGGTSWLWSREDFRDSVDVLFIDEAGQMSLADVLAVSAGAKSLVLLGDPQQLEQPQQASHPPGTQASALEHILGGAKTVPPERGLFLHQTRRLHPQICAFTAEAFYENRLASFPGLERQALIAAPGSQAARFGSAGLVFVPVEHDGNQGRAQEEVEAIEKIVAALTGGAVEWQDKDGKRTRLGPSDIMVVAPYNAQVTALAAHLPGVRIGTVDKFQGQQAPVVIVSLTTSTPEDAPRGMDFLYSSNRLNVATSRAKALCILVGNPRLFEPDCRTPLQMRLANAFCRYRELARTVSAP